MQELKPCPFCGGKAKMVCFLVYDDDNDEDVETYSAECSCCGCCTPFQNMESAAETWNARQAEMGSDDGKA